MTTCYIVTSFGHRGNRQWIFDRIEDALREIDLNPMMFDWHNEVRIQTETLTPAAYRERAQTYAYTRDAIESGEL